jgi:hypothetical protein
MWSLSNLKQKGEWTSSDLHGGRKKGFSLRKGFEIKLTLKRKMIIDVELHLKIEI